MIWLGILILVYVLALLVIAWVSVHPYRIPLWISPGSLGAAQEDAEFASIDGTVLKGWWAPAKDAKTVAIFAHGYMMNRCEWVPEAYLLWTKGVSCLLFDFRAHGRSKGRKCKLGVYERHDVAAAVGWVRERSPGVRILLVGSSMGSAASLLAMADDPSMADAAVLDSAYGRLDSAILGWWRFIGGKALALVLSPVPLFGWLFTGIDPFKVDLSKEIPKIGEKPILFCHGRCDNLALPGEAERNFAVACGPKQIIWFDGCGHSEGRWMQPEKYREGLLHFLHEQGIVEEMEELQGQRVKGA